MCLSLYDYQAKASRYWKGLTYLKNRATTNQNWTLHSQKLKSIQTENKWKSSNQKKKEKYRINWKTRFKMAINTYLSIIILNVNLLQSKDTEWQIGLKSKNLQSAIHKKLTLGQRTHID